MRRTQAVTSPDGDQWQVRRRWLDRPVPTIHRSLGETKENVAVEGGIEALFAGFSDSIPIAAGVTVVVALFVLVLLPLIGIALEVAILIALLSSGIAGRVLLRRPWIVEATNLTHRQQSVAFAVKGWGRSGQATGELVAAIRSSGRPERVSGGTPVSV